MSLYKEYDPATLKRLQQTELGILKDFAELCEENNIDYFGMGGTAIGAIRHGGFIPWDDDIDVGLTRENYDRFIRIVKKKYPDKYMIIDARSSENFPLMNTRMALRGTKFKEDTFSGLDVDNGIFLDIFCFENVSDNDLKMKWQIINAWFWGKILILKYIKEPVLYVKGIVKKIVLLGCRIMHSFLKIFNVSKRKLYRNAKAFSMMYNDRETKRVAFMFEPSPFMSILAREDIEPTRLYDFEGLKIRFPNRINVLLERRYGDYMTLPPEDKRHNHPPYLLEFPKEDNE